MHKDILQAFTYTTWEENLLEKETSGLIDLHKFPQNLKLIKAVNVNNKSQDENYHNDDVGDDDNDLTTHLSVCTLLKQLLSIAWA